MNHHTWLVFVFLVEAGFYRVGQADLELLTPNKSLTLSPGCWSAVVQSHLTATSACQVQAIPLPQPPD
ncbi:hypothetical protein AAY473_033898 [Plecturocebus cupreus]